ncbi:MAG: nucleotidyl transferase AbiEii/AbiGii toxin family protein [Acidobacteriaceae bacterium]|nr:nucleotidyl transferase AbiEii/AbiGii toxin family protein [Acidobacteriaceae bacterium]
MNVYKTASAFRKALEERLRQHSKSEEIDINRLRRKLAFDRLLARLFHGDKVPWALKGGYALELQFKAARSTVDIDLTMFRTVVLVEGTDVNQVIRDLLQQYAGISMGDWLEYLIGSAQTDIFTAPYGGARYPVEARMDNRVFARFHLDVGIGDVAIQPLAVITTRDWLNFAGIPAPQVQTIAKEQQFAEKVHAYTVPRATPNSRVKDLVDMALLVHDQRLDEGLAAQALRLTFARRDTHPIPTSLNPPPRDWQRPFESLAAECGIQTDCEIAHTSVNTFFLKICAKP